MSLELQQMLFEKKPNRRELLSYKRDENHLEYYVQVFRNHSFELIEHTMHAYLNYAGMNVRFTYSGYDDSFSFHELDSNADMIIVWIDTTRYKKADIQTFLVERIEELKKQYFMPILVIPFGEEVRIQLTDVVVFNLSDIEKELGSAFVDIRAARMTGTPLSGKAMAEIARKLGLRYLPALLCPSLKGIVVDFDNTLYEGVLGENGVEGVRLTPGHRKLQEKLKELAAQGFFLCAASKNELEDVDELLEKREDFPLRKEDFTKLCISWDSKVQSIKEITEYLNINADSLVFIDDNLGELMSVKSAYPQINLICASEDAEITCRVLMEYPRLIQMNPKGNYDRKADVQANEQRRALQEGISKEEYIRSLEINLRFELNNESQIPRIAELANKTNQFIFNYMRYSQSDIERRINDPGYGIVTISLSDRLSDSGLVGVCIGKKHPTHIEIEECFVSCRALGRGIDDCIVLGAIQMLIQEFSAKEVRVAFQEGARNEPAKRFVDAHLAQCLVSSAKVAFQLPKDLIHVEYVNYRK